MFVSNSRIRKFIFEYLNIVNQILQWIKHAGEIFLGFKTIIYNHITIVEFDCLY